MLINEVLDSKSIALSATENASNQIPYLGLQWFPERKKQGLDLSWIKTHKGLPVSLSPSNFDTIPTLRAREGLSKEKTQMAFFREGMTVGEDEMFEIERIQSAEDPYLASALSSVYDDTRLIVFSNGSDFPKLFIVENLYFVHALLLSFFIATASLCHCHSVSNTKNVIFLIIIKV